MDKKSKVVVAGRIPGVAGKFTPTPEEVNELAKVNAEFVVIDYATESEVAKGAKDADVILVGITTPMTRPVIEALPKCKVIIIGSVGFDPIDVDAATDNGIIVVNNPASEWCVQEVVNHTMALLLACAKKLVLLNNLTKQGNWSEAKQVQAPMVSIHGQTLGVIGCGAIGGTTAKVAQCFNLRVLANDPYIDKSVASEKGVTLVSLPELLKESDFVSMHTPLNEETRHLIGEKEFKQMKPSAYFINTSRGPVVDEIALIKALQVKWIAGAGLDVFAKEPVAPDNPLLKMDNVVVLPHSGSYSDESFKRPRIVIMQETLRLLSGRWPKNMVNKKVKPRVDLV
ncbi:C-terminal binding protein [Chloroflexota bacterium]